MGCSPESFPTLPDTSETPPAGSTLLAPHARSAPITHRALTSACRRLRGARLATPQGRCLGARCTADYNTERSHAVPARDVYHAAVTLRTH